MVCFKLEPCSLYVLIQTGPFLNPPVLWVRKDRVLMSISYYWLPNSGTESPISAAYMIYEISPHSTGFSKRKLITLPTYVWTLGGYLARLPSSFLYEIHELGAAVPLEQSRSFSCHCNHNALLSGVVLPLRELTELVSGQVRRAQKQKEEWDKQVAGIWWFTVTCGNVLIHLTCSHSDQMTDTEPGSHQERGAY